MQYPRKNTHCLGSGEDLKKEGLVSGIRKVCAILCSDLHLSENPPLARSSEDDWFKSMGRQLRELQALQEHYRCPVLMAGDLFDRWNSSANLINFAIRSLPSMYAIPGQHDLPHHSYKDIRRSAYWTMVESGIVTNIRPGKPVGTGLLRLHGFPFGFRPKALQEPHGLCIEIAMVHCFVWTKNTGYSNAPDNCRLRRFEEDLRNYDVAVWGDNHHPFSSRVGETLVWNCGGFYRRKSDEIEHRPSIGLLYDDKSIERKYLDCSKDKFIDPDALKALAGSPLLGDLSGFLDEVAGLQDAVADFREAVERFMDQERAPEAVRTAVLQAMEMKS